MQASGLADGCAARRVAHAEMPQQDNRSGCTVVHRHTAHAAFLFLHGTMSLVQSHGLDDELDAAVCRNLDLLARTRVQTRCRPVVSMPWTSTKRKGKHTEAVCMRRHPGRRQHTGAHPCANTGEIASTSTLRSRKATPLTRQALLAASKRVT